MRYYRKIIKIRAEDSPNVRRALEYQKRGLSPQNEILLPGVLTWAEYQKRRATWDKVRQTIGLDAEFYEGAENLLYPPDWLARAVRISKSLQGRQRKSEALGVDSGEGWANTSMIAVDPFGITDGLSKKTPDTDKIIGEVIAFGQRNSVPPRRWFFDRGGGGKQHADRLRAKGMEVGTVGFGEKIQPELRRGKTPLAIRKEARERKYTFKNRRAEMYWRVRELLDPINEQGFGIPDGEPIYEELLRQMSLIPLTYDEDGRIYILPKNKKNPNDTRKTLTEILGCSPDELDAFVLAVYGMEHGEKRRGPGAMF